MGALSLLSNCLPGIEAAWKRCLSAEITLPFRLNALFVQLVIWDIRGLCCPSSTLPHKPTGEQWEAIPMPNLPPPPTLPNFHSVSGCCSEPCVWPTIRLKCNDLSSPNLRRKFEEFLFAATIPLGTIMHPASPHRASWIVPREGQQHIFQSSLSQMNKPDFSTISLFFTKKQTALISRENQVCTKMFN